ncbi:MAG: endo-1,4-beta-xylanase [Anaerolineae bacterium]
MDERELLASADQRIRDHRTSEVTLSLVDASGQPLSNVDARVQQVEHAFRWGCNGFQIGQIKGDLGTPGSSPAKGATLSQTPMGERGVPAAAPALLEERYERHFAALLNYATLPFYWGRYEPQRGVVGQERLRGMAEWCQEHHVATKGHPLVWHEVYPPWAEALDDAEVVSLLEQRVHEIVSAFAGQIDIWDVVNEATISHRFDHAVGRWIAREGAAACVEVALRWAREANPSATLLYNDFNVSPALEQLIADLLDRDAPLDAIGIQSHMHRGTWPLERAWEVCEIYARYGLPLHWTELTVPSGRLKPSPDGNPHLQGREWEITPAEEAAQAEYGEKLYTLLFSHPAVDAITWWDFSDYRSWLGAPGGLVRADMSPKPLYERLLQRVQHEWHTDMSASTDEAGHLSLCGYHGAYAVTVRSGSGQALAGSFALSKGGPDLLRVQCSPLDQG